MAEHVLMQVSRTTVPAHKITMENTANVRMLLLIFFYKRAPTKLPNTAVVGSCLLGAILN